MASLMRFAGWTAPACRARDFFFLAALFIKDFVRLAQLAIGAGEILAAAP